MKRVVIRTECQKNNTRIVVRVGVGNRSNSKSKVYSCVIDTGAQSSAISSRLVSELSLETLGISRITTATQSEITTSHIVDFCLADNVYFQDVVVSKIPEYEDADAIIGMDILQHFDISLTGKGNNRVFELSLVD